MFGIGFFELMIVALVAFIFIKPEKLPQFFRKVGNLYREISKLNNKIKGADDNEED